MLRGISLQVRLALYQLCHVLISCLISESPNTVTNPWISRLKRSGCHSALTTSPFRVWAPRQCVNERTQLEYRLTTCQNLGQKEASGLENKKPRQECAQRRSCSRSGINAQTHRSWCWVRHFYQHRFSTRVQSPWRTNAIPQYPIIESSKNSTAERESRLECWAWVQLGEKRMQLEVRTR